MKEISLRDYLERAIARLRVLRSQMPGEGHPPESVAGEFRQILRQIEEAGIDVAEFVQPTSPAEGERHPLAGADALATRLDWAIDYLDLLLARNPKEITLLLPDDG